MTMKTKIVRKDNSLDSILQSIGNELYRLRIKKGYSSHADFAADHGLPRIQYWRLEKGKANLTLRSLAKVLAIHELSLEEFLGEILKRSRSENESL